MDCAWLMTYFIAMPWSDSGLPPTFAHRTRKDGAPLGLGGAG
jgi:hypothetical protein